MLIYLSELSAYYGPFNLFRYISFRTEGATATALFLVLFFGPSMIAALRVKQGKGQPIREDGPQSHLLKKGTPTMGGLMILASLSVTTLLWASPRSPYVWIVLFVTLGFGLIGFYDDYLKVSKQSHKGFSSKARLGGETAIAVIACYAMFCADLWPRQVDGIGGFFQALILPFTQVTHHAGWLALPFYKGYFLYLGWFGTLFGAFVIVAAGNAVNLTDGLDGLAIVPVMVATATFGIIAYIVGNYLMAVIELNVNYVSGAGELAVVAGAVIGAGLGFLWFNAPPAQIFMGDTGSLALGGLIGSIAVAIKHEIVLLVVGGLFVVEAVSVIIQVVYYKRTGKRIFLMAPIHHHFEKLGWSESQIVIRFWIIAFVLGLIGLSTLKVR